jgi:hypothetical protein
MHLDLGHLSQAQYRIIMEVALLHLPVLAGTGSWEDVGITLVDGNTIQIEYVSQQSEFDIVYGLTGASLAALNEELYMSLGEDDEAREAAYGQGPTSVAANGEYYLDLYTPDQLITVTKNMSYVDSDTTSDQQFITDLLISKLYLSSKAESRLEHGNDTVGLSHCAEKDRLRSPSRSRELGRRLEASSAFPIIHLAAFEPQIVCRRLTYRPQPEQRRSQDHRSHPILQRIRLRALNPRALLSPHLLQQPRF